MNTKLQSFLLIILITAVAFGGYRTFFPDATLKNFQIQLCEAGIAKSAIVKDFMLQAAAARRASAAAESEPIVAKNDLNAARHYEEDARRYDDLTVKNCNK